MLKTAAIALQYFKKLNIPSLPLNDDATLPPLMMPKQKWVVKSKTKGKAISAGRNFLLDQINHLTREQLNLFIKTNNIKDVSATELEQAIRELKFHIREDGAVIPAGEPLFAIEGYPLAIAAVKTLATITISSMTAKATYANHLVEITKGYKSKQERLKDAAFAYFGLRRGDTTDRSIDEAAIIGGFAVVANTNAYLTDNNKSALGVFAPIKNMILTGTTAHAFVTYLTSILMKAEKEGKVEDLFKALHLPRETFDRYNALRAQDKPDCGIYDFFSFCVYTQAVIEIGKGATVYLVDTTDTELGVKAAIEAATLMGKKDTFTGVRIDTDPKKYIALVAELYYQNKIPSAVKIYCTDGIDDKSIKEIYNEYTKWLEAHPGVDAWPLVFGIGSSVANTKPLEVSEEWLADSVKLHDSLNQSTVSLPAEKPAVTHSKNDVFNYHDTLPCDAYSCIQWALIEQINNNIRQNPELKGLVPEQSVATLHFRHRPNTPNYLIVAGVNAIINNLVNFTFNDEMIERIKATKAGFTDEFYRNLKNKKLNIQITTLKEGEIAAPYQPVFTVTGDPGHVLFVESYILSTFGSMSAKAAKAREVIHSLAFTENELKDNKNLILACQFYALDERAKNNADMMRMVSNTAKGQVPLNKSMLIKFLTTHFDPTFAYSGLSSQSTANAQAAYSAKLGGFKELPIIDDETVVIDFDESELYQVSDLIKEQKLGEYKKLVLRFDLPEDRMPVLRSQLIHAGITFDRVTFVTGKSIAQEENLKGTVYKGTASIYSEGPVEYCIKAGGAQGGKPDVKTSVPGADPQVILLKDLSGVPVATLIIDRQTYSSDLKGNDLMKSILSSEIIPYYQRNTSEGKSVIAVGQNVLDLSALTGEFLTSSTFDVSKAPEQFMNAASLKESSDQAALRVRNALNHEARPDLPVYMDKALYQEMCRLIRGESPVVKNDKALLI